MHDSPNKHCKYGLIDHEDELYAMKYIPSTPTGGLFNLHEIDILSRFKHPHIIHSSSILLSQKGLVAALPLCERTLHDFTISPMSVTSSKIQIIYKIASAICFLHQQNITGFDVSLDSIVLRNLEPYLADFSKCSSNGSGLIVPNGNKESDIFSFGLSCLYLFSGRVIQIKQEWVTDINFYEHCLSHIFDRYLIIDLISAMLHPDPSKRPTAEQILSHPLFQDIKYEIHGEIQIQEIMSDYADDHRDILKLIFHWAKTMQPKLGVSVMFLAVDLFNRAASSYKNKTTMDRMILATSCLLLAFKLYNIETDIENFQKVINSLVPEITYQNTLKTEIEVVHFLKGMLSESKFEKCCSNSDQLKYCLYEILLSKDTSTYATTKCEDLKTFLNENFSNGTDEILMMENL